jgi:hypothetical protein
MNWLRKKIADGSLLFALLPFIYFLLYGFDGFADTDQGFVAGLAWRVKIGQIPYLDFVYVRPPLTPVLHALELWIWPIKGQVLGMRLDYYLMMAASVAFGIQSLKQWVDFAEIGIRPWVLGTLALMFSLHNYPALPWHTVDGIFFGSLGIWLITHPKTQWRMVLGLLALALAGLAKQPFAIMLPLGFGWIFLIFQRKVAFQVSFITICLLLTLTIALLIWLPEGFATAMLTQISGASKPIDLLKAGFGGYLLPLLILVIPSILVFRWAGKNPDSKSAKWIFWAFLAGFALIPLAHAGLAFWKMTFVPPKLGIFHALWFAGFLYAIRLIVHQQRCAGAALLLMVALAWASSLSWGYAFPVLFALPGVFGFFGFLRMAFPSFSLGNSALRWIGAAVFVGFFVLHIFPYRDAPRWEMGAGAGDLFPELAGIRMGQENFEKLESLYFLDQRYADNLVVLPAQPGISYLAHRIPRLSIDWEHDAEIGLENMEIVLQELQQPNLAIAVEIGRSSEANSKDAHYGSKVLKYVLENGFKTDSILHFDIYRLSPSR